MYQRIQIIPGLPARRGWPRRHAGMSGLPPNLFRRFARTAFRRNLQPDPCGVRIA